MNRRQFMQFVALSGVLAAYPRFALASRLPSSTDVLFLTPSDSDYAMYVELFNKRIVRHPRIVAVCFSEKGVQDAIALARAQGLPVAVRSGGHSFEGFSLNDDGLSIDLTRMNAHQLLDNGRFVTGPACRLMEMYESLIPQGRLIPAGSCGMVGIAGLTLGGGYGIFSREHGLAIDWLKRIRLVDGQGKVHEVAQGSDLFWACRGAGNGNFGVVTELQFDTLNAPSHISRYQFKAGNLTPQRLGRIARVWFAVSAQLPNEAFSAFVHNGKSLNILVTSTQGSLTPGMSDLLRQLEEVMDKRLPDRQQELLPGIRRYYGKLTPLNFKNASAGYYRSYADIEQVAEQIFETVNKGNGLLFQINTLGGAIRKAGPAEAHGCYPHRDYAYLGEIQSYWESPAHEAGAIAAVEQVQKLLAGNGINAHYSNYPDINFEHWPSQYFGAANYTRLQAIKKQYDPDNLFRYAQSIRPA